MLTYALKRVALAMPTMFLAAVLTFLTLSLVPGDPVEIMLIQLLNELPTPAELDEFRAELGFDRPIYIRFFIWLTSILQGDFGISSRSGEPVLSEIARTLPVTVEVGLASLLVTFGLAFPAGITSAVRHNTLIDYATRFAAILGISMPSFWLALLLMLVFAVNLGLLPVFGRGGVEHLILPAITLGVGGAALTTRLLRSSMLEVLSADYIRTARAKGLKETIVVWKHALRSALIPVVTVIGLQIGFVLGGSVIVETVFALPGVGWLMVESINARDFSMVQGITLLYAMTVIVANLLVDLSYVFLDPRIRY